MLKIKIKKILVVNFDLIKNRDNIKIIYMDYKLALIEDSDSEEEFFDFHKEKEIVSNETETKDSFDLEVYKKKIFKKDKKKESKKRKKSNQFFEGFTFEPENRKPKIRVNIDPTLINNDKVKHFVDYCIKKELVSQKIDNTCFLNIISSGLPDLYSSIADSFGNITERSFTSYFKKIGYNQNLKYLYQKMLNRKKKLTWFKFYSFFYTIIQN